jgi:hypothetical protein
MMNAKEHYEWCVKQAEEYLDAGDDVSAFSSFVSDMSKNPVTQRSITSLMMIALFEYQRGTEPFRRFIKGFNF